MPKFIIEDNETGIKIPVNSKSVPTQKEAESIVNNEILSLSTNLHAGPNGKFILDVGPLAELRSILDKETEGHNTSQKITSEASVTQEAIRLARRKFKLMEDAGQLSTKNIEEWSNKYRTEVNYQIQRLSSKQLGNQESKIIDDAFSKLDDNTLLIIAHGKESGGLQTEWGHDFAVSNIAKLLHYNTNSISKVINAACYGGKCKIEDFTQSFPNLNTVTQTDDSNQNIMSLQNIRAGDFFGKGVKHKTWNKRSVIDELNEPTPALTNP